MRRGHPNRGGWRGESPRHFRPRNSAGPSYRPQRPFSGNHQPNRFSSPWQHPRAPLLGAPYHNQSASERPTRPYGNNPYRKYNQNRPQHQTFNFPNKSIFQKVQQQKQDLNNECGDDNYKQNYHDDFHEPGFSNRNVHSNFSNKDHPSMQGYGNTNLIHQDEQIIQRFSSDDDYSYRGLNFNNPQHENPSNDYSAHRPPESVHYKGSANNLHGDSESFKHLMDRQDIPNTNYQDHNDLSVKIKDNRDTFKKPLPAKHIKPFKRPNTLNCTKMKNKIFQELFKNKQALQKFVDSPQSSSKFEYAINSLLNESQNSLNKHLRDAADKSLRTAGVVESLQSDDNVYEDTFMKEMQSILDPRDSVLLTDIKPLVMSEISKVLQLDDCNYQETEPPYPRNIVLESYHEYQSAKTPLYSESALIRTPGYHESQVGIKSPSLHESTSTKNPSNHENLSSRPPLYDFQNYQSDMKSTIIFSPEENEQSRCDFVQTDDSSRSHNRSHDSYDNVEKVNHDNLIISVKNKSPKKKHKKSRHHDRTPSSEDNDDVPQKIETVVSNHNNTYDNLEYYDKKQYEDISTRRMSVDCPYPVKETPSVDGKSKNIANRRKSVPPQFLPHSEDTEESEPVFPSPKFISPKEKEAINEQTVDTKPLFDGTLDSLSDGEDPFAELDKQYHVAVDHSFTDFEEGELPPSSPPVNPPKAPAKHQPPKKEVSKPPLIQSKSVDIPKNRVSNQDILRSLYAECTEKIQLATQPNASEKAVKVPIPKKIERTHSAVENLECAEVKQEIVELVRPVETKAPSNKTEALQKSPSRESRKRKEEQDLSHRKEKRKKSDSSIKVETGKVLNKNIIINVNDCAAKEKCDPSGSIFNLYFSKHDKPTEQHKETKKTDLNISYSDKYVKRKKSHLKEREKNKPNNSSDTSSTKSEKSKLKDVNLFNQIPKKQETSPLPLVKPLIIKKNKVIQKMQATISTQTHRKCATKFAQTEVKNNVHKAVQTEKSTPKKRLINREDVLDRMKEIDLEIQSLLQEKFKLYNSLESKEASTKNLQNFGMTVVNVNPLGSDSDDAIIDNLTNVSEEEIEDIALIPEHSCKKDTLEILRSNKTPLKRSKVKNTKKVLKKQPETAFERKSKHANISLIEQIINDDRPIEELISLEELEMTETPKSKKNGKAKTAKSKKKKVDKETFWVPVHYTLKDCSIMLERHNMSRYLKSENDQIYRKELTPVKEVITPNKASKPAQIENEFDNEVIFLTEMDNDIDEIFISDTIVDGIEEKSNIENNFDLTDTDNYETLSNHEQTVVPSEHIVEESVISELQIQDDMMYVSEDIIIGNDITIEKSSHKDSTPDKEIENIMDIGPIDALSSKPNELSNSIVDNAKSCMTYDFSVNEELKKDMVMVAGHNEQVLAIESTGNDFLAACLNGNVYHFSGSDGRLITTLRGSNLGVTCLCVVEEKYGTTVYTGSLDSRIRYYDLENGLEKGPECNVLSAIQSMDRAWDTIFVGTRTGFVLQFECKNNMLIPVSTVKFSDQSILAIKALKEGPRKVLLVAPRSENVTIKDAQTGLLLRTLEGPSMTVYTLLFEDGKVYCGTSGNQIQVFDYASGSSVGSHIGGKGAVCLRAAGGLLFAGCYDGCVYVFKSSSQDAEPIAQLRGPSVGMLLSLAVLHTKIIAGYHDGSLYIWKLPSAIAQEMVL